MKILPEIQFSSKAKMYRYHQIDGTMVPGDYDTKSYCWICLIWPYLSLDK